MNDNDEFELIQGSGNVFRDFERPNADLEQARAMLAAEIIRTLDERKLSVREAECLIRRFRHLNPEQSATRFRGSRHR